MLLGDLIEDRYIHCFAERISPEAPMPVFVQEWEEVRKGGVGNVHENLLALGSKPTVDYVPCNSVKIRYVCDGKIVFRSDQEHRVEISVDNYDYSSYNDYTVLSDYDKGALVDTELMIKKFNETGTKVIVDAKKPISRYRGAWLVKMNEAESRKFIGTDDYEKVMAENDIENILITLGGVGALLTSKNSPNVYVHPKQNKKVADTTGAGDVVTAALAHFLDSGSNILEACFNAVELASISVSYLGTHVLTDYDIRKVKPRVVFTNGCFDILHRGHIDLLKKSREYGDQLIVGINSDESVRRLKGDDRPINTQEDRAAALRALKYVDKVVVFDEPTPIELIRKLKPDVITKGGDYEPKDVVGNELARVVIIPTVEGLSTTNIIERIRQ